MPRHHEHVLHARRLAARMSRYERARALRRLEQADEIVPQDFFLRAELRLLATRDRAKAAGYFGWLSSAGSAR